MRIDFGLRHIATANEGERARRGGEIVISSDGKDYFYLGRRGEGGAFRAWARCFLHNDGRDRIAGRAPVYYVTSAGRG